jgi:hypothetical protein
VLTLRAIASGSIVTVPTTASPGLGRLEITALFATVDILVPMGWKVYLDCHPTAGIHHDTATAATSSEAADLQVVAFAVGGTVQVRAA